MNAQTLGNEWDSGDPCDINSSAYDLEDCAANNNDNCSASNNNDSGDPCDPASCQYSEAICNNGNCSALNNNDSGDPCDPASCQYNETTCNNGNCSALNNNDSGDPCDPASCQYNETTCNNGNCSALNNNDSGDPCDPASCQYSEAICNNGNCSDFDENDSGNPCDQASCLYNEEDCEQSKCDKNSENYDPTKCDQCQYTNDLLAEIFGDENSTPMAVRRNSASSVSNTPCCGANHIQRDGNCVATGAVNGLSYLNHDAAIQYLLNMSNGASSMSNMGLDLFPAASTLSSAAISGLFSLISKLKNLTAAGIICSVATVAWQGKYTLTSDLYKKFLTKFVNDSIYAGKGLYLVHTNEYVQSLYGAGTMVNSDEFYSEDGCLVDHIGY